MQDYFYYKPGGEIPQPNPFDGDPFGVSSAGSSDNIFGSGDWMNEGGTSYDPNPQQDAYDNTADTAMNRIRIPQ